MQSERRRNDYPLTWELPALATTGFLLTAVWALHIARAIANVLAGGAFALPTSNAWIRSLPALIAGNATAGLTPPPAQHASPALLWAVMMVVELLTFTVLIVALAYGNRRFGRGQIRGAATTTQAAAVLGAGRLRANRHIIRPDRYPRPRGRLPSDELTGLGWRLGVGDQPRCGALWAPWDRTTGVIGPQGSGKTLDLLIPALLQAPGAALTTLTKVDDLLLSLTARQRDGRPVSVLDPFTAAPGLPELVWDPIAGCQNPMTAERRAKAFTAGTISGAARADGGEGAARFYAGEAAKVLQTYFHAAALAGRTLDDVLRWVANPTAASEPSEILRGHAGAAPFWSGLLHGALYGDPRTAGNTTATVQQAMALFFQPDIRRRCVPGPGRPATDIADVIARGGTFYLLGRDDPYASASPLMTAITEHILDAALAAGTASPWGRLCPPLLACLDELPSTAPLPTLRTRMANERALGISIMWAAQTRQQLTAIYGDDEARSLIALTNILVVFGGSKDPRFNQELSDLLGSVTVPQISYNGGKHPSRTIAHREIPVLTGAEIRELPERIGLVIPENSKPVLARLHRCIDGKAGKDLLAQQKTPAARSATPA